ncbi:xylulokinase [Paracoccus pacificus]|uniref:Xylulose kinase n=1 Tax=Paracoccus pacificus TaxID=1463598 RepID=A0ABW4RBS6_9RHOB
MFLGIDLGTSGVKAVLIDGDQTVLATGHSGLTVMRPRPGWSEQNPADWIAATEAALDQIAAAHPLTKLRGIGLSGQMHGAVCLDAADQVLRPAILWDDGRAAEQAAALDADPAFRAITGNIVFAGFTAPKLVWMAAHEPEIRARVAKVLLPKDYLRLWLSGEMAGDMSDASGTAWFDPARRDWSDRLLAATGLSRDQMPRLVEGSQPSGRLRAELAGRWGIAGSPVIAGGAGDNAATAIGAGIVGPGTGFVSLGTSGVIFAATDRFLPAPESAVHAFCHALPERWHQMGVMLSASASLEWLAAITGTRPAELTAELTAAPGAGLRPPGAVRFLPYLSGERTPHNDPTARGLLSGLSAATDRAALTQAVLEGVSFGLRDSLEAMRAAGGAVDRLLAMGGGARSDYWLSLLATTLNLPIDRPEGGETGAAFGAARLGMLAVGAADLSALTAPAIAGSFDPDPALVPAFDAAYAEFRADWPLALDRHAVAREGVTGEGITGEGGRAN